MRWSIHCRQAGFAVAVCVLTPVRGQSLAEGVAGMQQGRFPVAPHIREAIRSRLPAYTPAGQDGESTATTENAPAEMNDEVLALPKMTVRRPMKESLNAVDWMTPAGRLEHAMKKYPGAHIGNFFGLNAGWALACLQEDLDVERKSALRRTGAALAVATDAHDRETLKLLRSVLLRAPRGPLRPSP